MDDLSDRARQVLAFERDWQPSRRSKAGAILDALGMSPARYY